MIKRLSGGLILLCLTSISLGVTSGEVSITDSDVLEQLKELRTFIDVNRDFSKGFKNLKPVLIEYRSSASKFNGIALGNLSFNTDALHMSIGINTIQADGKMLIVTINVVYEWEDYIGYKVKSAKLIAYETLATGDGTFTGDVGVGQDLSVTGDASVGGDLSITGDVEVDTDSEVKIFENIVDKAGNHRFIEGDLTPINDLAELSPFAHWSLSGSHLMLVLCVYNTTDEDITISGASELAHVELPTWIINKIFPMGESGHVAMKSGIKGLYPSSLTPSSTDVTAYLLKTESTLYLNGINAKFESGDYYRIEFDLLIDDEYE